MAWRSVRQIASRMPAGSQRHYRHRHVFVHCGQSLQSMIPTMIIEPAATTTEQITGNSSRTAITAARRLWFRAKRQLATPIRKLRLAPVASFYQREAVRQQSANSGATCDHTGTRALAAVLQRAQYRRFEAEVLCLNCNSRFFKYDCKMAVDGSLLGSGTCKASLLLGGQYWRLEMPFAAAHESVARNGHTEVSWQCPLLGEQRKSYALIELFRF